MNLKILSWNLYNFYDYDFFLKEKFFENEGDAKNYVAKRVKIFSEVLKKENSDIMFFNEVGNFNLIKELAENVYGENYFLFNTTPDIRGIFNAAISRKKCDFSEIFIKDLELPNFEINKNSYKDKYLTQKRGYIRASFYDTNIYGVHLKSQLPSNIKNNDGSDYEVKTSDEKAHAEILGEIIGLAESYAIRKIISEDIKNNKEVILLGDYNADSFSRRLKILRGMKDETDEMMDVFNIDDENKFTLIYKKHKTRFDHILVSKNIFNDMVKGEVLNKTLKAVKENTWHDIDILDSDHACITLEINLKLFF